MRLDLALTIFSKEIRETLRDRRTLLMMIGLPILLYPLMIIVVGKVGESKQQEREARSSVVAVWGALPEGVAAALGEQKAEVNVGLGLPDELARELADGRLAPAAALAGARVKPGDPRAEREVENPVQAAARAVVSSKQAQAVIVVWPGFGEALATGGLGRLTLYYDSVNEDSRAARERVAGALGAAREEIVARREQQRGLVQGFGRALELMVRTVASRQRELGGLIGAILPLLLITISASGGFYAAIDLTAGEKERNTMQTLLCAPVRSTEIIAGKFLAVWTVVLVSGLANIVSMAVTFARLGSSVGGFALPATTYALAFVALLPVTFTVSGLFLAVAVLARDFKDGQNLLTPVLLILMMPVGVTMVPGVELDAATAFVPFVNVALLIKALFIGEVRPEALFLTVLASALYAALAMLFAARVFGREQILLGGRESAGRLLGIGEWRGRMPTPGLAFSLYASLLVLTFYGSRALEGRGVLSQMLAVQYLFFALPTLGLALGLGLPMRQTFSLRLPPMRALAGAALIGLSAWAVVGATLVRLAPPPPELARQLAEALLLGGRAPLWLLLLAVALTPAVCEELLFRGFILSGLRRLGPWAAIGGSALLFALVHASIYRLLPTLTLGLLLGYAVWRSRSIVCGMVGHLLNNGIAVVILHRATSGGTLSEEALGGAAGGFVPWEWALPATLALALGVWLTSKSGT